MVTDIVITPVDGELDMDEITARLASTPNAALDPVGRRIYMLAGSRERLRDAVEARLVDPTSFPYSVALVDPAPTRVDVSYRSSSTIEPARRFVQWLRTACDVRITDEAFHDITGECDELLENIFGPWTPPSFDVEPCSLSDLGALGHRYARGVLPSGHPVLVVRLEGSADLGIDEVFDLASAIVMAGLEAWEPAGLVLDLQALTYEWGDRMQKVLAAPQRWYEPLFPRLRASSEGLPERFPLAVLTSALCREGLTSLIREELQADPAEILFDSIEEATAALDRALAGVPVP